jgi:hypothetical protein
LVEVRARDEPAAEGVMEMAKAVAEEPEGSAPKAPGSFVWTGLNGVVESEATGEREWVSFQEDVVKGTSGGVSKVTGGSCLEEKSAVIDGADDSGGPRWLLGKYDVRDVKIMFALFRGDEGVIKFQGAVEAMEEGTEGENPCGLKMGERGGDILEDQGAGASHVLVSRGGDVEELASFKVSAPKLEEEHELTNALFSVEGA